jgi:hypothetical protein
MNVSTKEELNFLVDNIVKNKNAVENKEEFLLMLRNKVYELFLKEGDIPPSYYMDLYFLFNDTEVSSHEEIQKFINTISGYYDSAQEEEKILMNNLLFILEMLNGKPKTALKNFIKRGLSLIYFAYLDNGETKKFIKFVTENHLDERALIEGFKEKINEFFNLTDTERRSVFVNGLSILWNNPSMFNNKIWLESFDDLVKLLNELIKKEMIEEQMYVHFFTYHIYGNNIHTIDEWRVFNEKVEKPASFFYKQWGEKNDLKQCKNDVSEKKKKIGFLFDRMVLNSPFMVVYSLIKALQSNGEFRRDYEIYVYSMSYIDKSADDNAVINSLLDLGVNFYSNKDKFAQYGYYYSHLQKALDLREKIISDGIDYLIGGFGYDIPNFIFSNRSAPKQIFWSHGNCTTDIENIDLRISHFEQECKEYEWKIFNVPMAEEFLVGSEEYKTQGMILKETLKQEFGENTVFLGTIGRLVKIDSDEYLQVVSEIMKQNPNTVYLACGTGNQDKIREKLKKYGIDEKRFIFTGQVNPHVFGWVIDVWPDSFPLRQGQSKNEYIAKGGVVVFMDKYLNDTIRNWYKGNDISVCAKNINDYVELVSLYINDLEAREKVSKFNKMIFQSQTTNFLEVLNDTKN